MDSLTFIGTATTDPEAGQLHAADRPQLPAPRPARLPRQGAVVAAADRAGLPPDELPPLDAVVLSHLHGDHFDRVARKELDRSLPLVTTEAAARRLQRYGFRTQGLRHVGRSRHTKGDETLRSSRCRAIHARGADGRAAATGDRLDARAPRRRRGHAEASMSAGTPSPATTWTRSADGTRTSASAVVHLGGTRVLFHTVTMDAGQGVDFLRRVRPARALPVHYDDYRVFRSPIEDWVAPGSRGRVRQHDLCALAGRDGDPGRLRPGQGERPGHQRPHDSDDGDLEHDVRRPPRQQVQQRGAVRLAVEVAVVGARHGVEEDRPAAQTAVTMRVNR